MRLAAGTALLLTAGCERAESGAVPVTVIGTPPRLVDPAAGPLTPAQAVLLASVAQGLVRFDPAGQIEPGLAERWNVSNDGLSYIFRLAADTWPNGRKINAADVARLLRRQLAEASRNPLKDTVAAAAPAGIACPTRIRDGSRRGRQRTFHDGPLFANEGGQERAGGSRHASPEPANRGCRRGRAS
jgi:ABC-type transport system substrate-binding protein